MGGSAKKMFGGGALGATLGGLAGFLVAGPAGAAIGATLGGAQGASTGKQTYDAEKLAKQEAKQAEELAKIEAGQMVQPSSETVLNVSEKDTRNALKRTILTRKKQKETFGGNSETLA